MTQPQQFTPARRVVVAPPRALANRDGSESEHLQTAPNRKRGAPFAAISQPISAPGEVAPAQPGIMPIRQVLIALFTCLLISVLLDARGIVHSGLGMPDGIERSATLFIGNAASWAGDRTGVAWPWNTLASARGYHPQPSVPPLMASGSPGSGPGSTAVPGMTVNFSARRTTRVARKICRSRTCKHFAVHHALRPHRVITRANPLRLLVTGDSLTEYLGPLMANDMPSVGLVRTFVETHYGTGLVRPDFVDWSLLARQQVTADNPDAVIVMMGGNDFQNLVVGSKILIAGTPAWTREYQRRAAVCMRIWTRGGTRRVYWLSIPPARDAAWARVDQQINLALSRAAAVVRGARYVNILAAITDHGKYSDFVPVNGQQTLVREPDGVHLNLEGSTVVANELVPMIQRAWHLHR